MVYKFVHLPLVESSSSAVPSHTPLQCSPHRGTQPGRRHMAWSEWRFVESRWWRRGKRQVWWQPSWCSEPGTRSRAHTLWQSTADRSICAGRADIAKCRNQRYWLLATDGLRESTGRPMRSISRACRISMALRRIVPGRRGQRREKTRWKVQWSSWLEAARNQTYWTAISPGSMRR